MIVWIDKACIEKVCTNTQRLAALASLQTLIDTLLGVMAAAALNANIKEYGYDDSQTKTKFVYNDITAISAQIKALMALQQMYLQMPGGNSRVVRMLDRSALQRFGCMG